MYCRCLEKYIYSSAKFVLYSYIILTIVKLLRDKVSYKTDSFTELKDNLPQ